MPLDFPSSPALNEVFAQFKWDGEKWGPAAGGDFLSRAEFEQWNRDLYTNQVHALSLIGPFGGTGDEQHTSDISPPIRFSHTGRAIFSLGQSWSAAVNNFIAITLRRSTIASYSAPSDPIWSAAQGLVQGLQTTVIAAAPLSAPVDTDYYYWLTASANSGAFAIHGGSFLIMEI